MSTGNEAQIEYWNSNSGGKWVRQQHRMDRTLSPFSNHLQSVLGAVDGLSILDVGCGTGETSVALAERGARVTAVDVSQPMLAHARTRPGADKVNFLQADASAHGFAPASHDLIFSRFGVMFFSDPDSAFAHMATALKPGGRVGFICWRPLSENPWMLKPVLIAKDFIELPARPGPEDPGPFSFSDPARVTRILSAGGLEDISIEPFDNHMFMGDNVEDAVITSLEVGPIGTAIEDVEEATSNGLKAALADLMSKNLKDGQVTLPGAVWCVTARKPR